MKKIFTFLFVVAFVQICFGQGVFTSLATGNWSAPGSWTLSSGTDADGIPDADDNVSITTHNITIPASTTVECNNLTVSNAAQRVIMGGTNSILNIYGTLNADATPTIETIIDCTADATARVVFKRTTNGVLFGTPWAAIGTGLRFEVDLPSGIIGTASTNVKAREITITSGTLSVTNTSGLRPDGGPANTGILTIQNGATLIVTAFMARTGTANTSFAALTLNGTGKIIFNGTFATALPIVASGFPVYTYSSGAVIEYQGGGQIIADINYPNLVINATTAGTAKTWSPAENRLATSITVTQGILAYGNGVTCTVSGNIFVASTGTISASSSANRFVASGAGRTFTLNGTARVNANETQTGAATLPFSYQYNNFASYTFAPTSWVSFRSPTTTTVTQGIDGIAGSPFSNVEIAAITNLTAAGSNTHTFKSNVDIAGILAFPRITAATNTSLIINFGSFTIKVGGNIQLNGSNANGHAGGRTYNSGTSSIELNGTTAQNTLGGTDLPSTFYNLKLNNSVSVTVANPVTVSNMLTLAGNNTYTNLSNVTGYTGLEYGATVAQTTGSEFGISITNLTINNSNGISLNADKTVSGVLTLTSGNITTGINILTLGSTGTVSRTSGHIVGSLRKNSFTGNKTFEVGTSTGYTPVDLVATGTGDFTVRSVGTSHPNAVGSNVLQMYWTLTNSGLTSADLTFNYLDAHVVGNELLYELGRYSSGWAFPSPFTINTTTNTVSINGVTTFSDWTLGEGGALPVELTSFTATSKKREIILNWQTATEINNFGFEVHRANVNNNTEELNWEKIGFVQGHGNSNSPKNYSFTDNTNAGSNFAFRLKQLDNDGQFEFSKVIKVKVELVTPKEFSLKQNYPNPFNPSTKIEYQLPFDANVTIELYGITGEKIADLIKTEQSAGYYTLDVNGNSLNLTSGVYIYRMVAVGKTDTKAFVSVKKMLMLK
ncbi:MAG: hypothetical protein C0425_10585 [Chlorobiaceae bacterium]|nr:hypothetical protein [Chlorobiaceae bacterium]MBA4310763.1 hypothetical protein [Chlorobiaceae bacterium]